MDWQGLVISAGVQGGIGLLFWLTVQRTVEKVDRLQREIEELKDNRVLNIEHDVKDESEKNAARRKEIYERLAKVERESVTVQKCHDQHVELNEGWQEYRMAVVDLARVQEKVTSTAAFVSQVNERVIGLAADVARMEGQNGRG